MKLTKIAAAIALACSATTATHAANITVKIIAFNDFHGQLESPGTLRTNAATATPTIPVGGVDWMAGYIARAKSQRTSAIMAVE